MIHAVYDASGAEKFCRCRLGLKADRLDLLVRFGVPPKDPNGRGGVTLTPQAVPHCAIMEPEWPQMVALD
jgi:hypothetical protein